MWNWNSRRSRNTSAPREPWQQKSILGEVKRSVRAICYGLHTGGRDGFLPIAGRPWGSISVRTIAAFGNQASIPRIGGYSVACTTPFRDARGGSIQPEDDTSSDVEEVAAPPKMSADSVRRIGLAVRLALECHRAYYRDATIV